MPAEDLVNGSEKKVLLRAAYAKDLPQDVLSRPKQGFGAPIGAWLEGPLREFAHGVFPCPLLDSGRQKNLHGQQLWTMVAFAGWAREWRASW